MGLEEGNTDDELEMDDDECADYLFHWRCVEQEDEDDDEYSDVSEWCIIETASEYKRVADFRFKDPYIYKAAVEFDELEDACSHMDSRGKSAEWELSEVKEHALEYSNRTDFRKKSRSAYNAALKNQWIDDVCQHMVTEHKPLKQPRKSWSVEEIQAEALKFSTRTEFKAKSRAYEAAKRKKLLDVVCAHMTPVNKKWTIEMVRRQAKKYQTRNKFNEGSHQAYLAAHRNDWLERVCNHMN